MPMLLVQHQSCRSSGIGVVVTLLLLAPTLLCGFFVLVDVPLLHDLLL